ncbi:MAG TPA: rhodanese-like domain-containing protein [Candidatus Angelobacter sp.]|nr:rhodanese-like domain-containing protein [Candidatus Angelobacter sp.]
MSSVPTEVSAGDAAAAVDRGDALLLDVREQWEWDEQRIPGAVHIPMNQVPSRLEEIPADRDVYVYCKVGGRSARVVDYLRRHGRERAVNVAGGIDAWVEAGLPVE